MSHQAITIIGTMPSRTRRKNYQNLFILLISITLVGNFIFDLTEHRRAIAADDSGRKVSHSYETIRHLQRLDRRLEQIQTPPDNATEFTQALVEIDALRRLGGQSIDQSIWLDQIEVLLRAGDRVATKPANEIVARMLAQESSMLSQSLLQDGAESRSLRSSLIDGLVVDSVLFIVMLSLFLGYRSNQSKIEQGLALSLASLREMNLALEEERVKRQMLSRTTVHDLKNPLGSIHGFADLLKDEATNASSVLEFSETIKRISQSSLQLVNSLLDTVETPSLTIVDVDLKDLVEEVVAQATSLARAKNQTIELGEIPQVFVRGDHLKLEELVFNLLGNAIKYSPHGSVVKVRAQTKAKSIRIEIEDQGPGFTENDLAKAFQYGQTLTAKPTGGESSTGYGLFMAKRVVDLHQGAIGILKPASGFGACVYFEIPRADLRKPINPDISEAVTLNP